MHPLHPLTAANTSGTTPSRKVAEDEIAKMAEFFKQTIVNNKDATFDGVAGHNERFAKLSARTFAPTFIFVANKVLDIIWSGRLAVTNAALPDFDFYAGAILPHLVTVSTDHFEMATKSSICSDESTTSLGLPQRLN
jgi:hypothetical protein